MRMRLLGLAAAGLLTAFPAAGAQQAVVKASALDEGRPSSNEEVAGRFG